LRSLDVIDAEFVLDRFVQNCACARELESDFSQSFCLATGKDSGDSFIGRVLNSVDLQCRAGVQDFIDVILNCIRISEHRGNLYLGIVHNFANLIELVLGQLQVTNHITATHDLD